MTSGRMVGACAIGAQAQLHRTVRQGQREAVHVIPEPSPNKKADPLKWPFHPWPPKDLQRLLDEEAAKQPKPVYPPAPF